jgi:trimethylamine:corrinoid methyltransferase-like protein
MYEAAGRKYTLAVEPMISPLKLDCENMALYLRWAEDTRINISEYGAIPMAGATVPLIFPAGLAAAFAESFALDYIFRIYSEGRHGGGFGLRLDHIDMKSLNMVYGSPENLIIKKAIIDLWRELVGGAPVSCSLHSNSRRVDAQAVIEKTTAMMYLTGCGVRVFGSIGQLSLDEVFSPVMAVIDREIIKTGNRLLRSLGNLWDEGSDTLEIVLEGLEERNYLNLESTVGIFREFFDLDMLASYENCASWISGGFKGIEEKARDEVKIIAASHDFMLSEDRAREVNKLADRF